MALLLERVEISDVQDGRPPLLIALYSLLTQALLLFGSPAEQERPHEQDEPDHQRYGNSEPQNHLCHCLREHLHRLRGVGEVDLESLFKQ